MNLTLHSAEPVVYIPLDNSAAVLGADGESFQPGVVHGHAGYVAGVSGQALNVTRHAYDQVTACEFSALPAIDCNAGTLSFWFKPHWKESDEGIRRIIYLSAGQGFRIYMVKNKQMHIDTSVNAPKQIQILSKDIFRQDEWAHVALSWDTRKAQVLLYINGLEVGNQAVPECFQHIPKPRKPVMWLGESSADRFKANVGDGVYDEIKLFNAVLPPANIAALAAGGAQRELAVQALTNLRQFQGGLELTWQSEKPFCATPRTLLKMKNEAQEMTVVNLGASRKLALFIKEEGKTEVIESNYVLKWDEIHQLRLGATNKSLALYLDGALQGRIALNEPFTSISSLEAASELTLLPKGSFPDAEIAKNLQLGSISPLEASLWNLSDAAQRTNGVRTGVCLNGYWRVQPIAHYSYAPPTSQWGYMRVPGSFRSPLFDIWSNNNGKLSSLKWRWQDKELISYRAAWYQRGFAVPKDFDESGRVFLNFTNLNGDSGRIYLNGKLIHSFRQDFKNFTAVPNAERLDVTEFLLPASDNALTLFIDRDYVGLWKGVPSINDHAEIALDNIWLEHTPSSLAIRTALALPSVRKKNITLRARLQNPGGHTSSAELEFKFTRSATKYFRHKFELNGQREQLVVFTAPWANPELWDAENPRLYAMTVTLQVNDKVADSLGPQSFGFRECWVEEGEIRLNGQKTRLRMWACPALNRLRYYYGHPDAVGQYVAHIRKMNYDTVRFDPIRKTSQVCWSEYLDACNHQGLYNLFPMPPYEDEELSFYGQQVERFLEHYGNHPTIIMWYTDFNTCSYAWNQDPAKLNDTNYEPPGKQQPRRRAQTAEKVMRAMDSSRELFQHAGGNSGRIFTSMNYQSLGTPLQEQEDWPRQWSEKHTQPLMVVESAFPYPMQVWHFDDESLGSLAAEHAARYFGDAVYARESLPIPNVNNWQISPYANWAPNMQALYTMLYSHVPRAWRAYDISCLGDFPGGRDLFFTARTYNDHNVVYRSENQVKTPGLKPDLTTGWSETQRHLLTDYTQPDYIHDIVRSAFEPLLIFLGGDPENFTNKDHAFYTEEKFLKSIVAVNDHRTAQNIEFRWELCLQGAEIPVSKGQFGTKIAAGEIAKLPIELQAPEVFKRTNAELRMIALRNGILHKEESLTLQFFPKRDQLIFRDVAAGVYDPKGKTTEMLKKAGFPCKPVKTLEELRSCRLLIIGQNALSRNNPDFLINLEKEGLIKNGLKVLIFEQQPCNLGNLVFESPSYRNAFMRRPESPLLAGLQEEDLSNWRGDSDTVPPYVLSAETSPHYPRSKWKCGNGGIVSGHVIRKPSYGNFQSIVDSGFNLMFASLLKLRQGHGIVLFCQLDVTSRYGIDPAATRLVDNMLSEMSSRFVPIGAQRVCLLGSDADEKMLERMGMIFRRGHHNELWKINYDQVIIIGNNPVPAEKTEALRAILADTKRTIIALPGAPLEVLPGGMQRGSKPLFKASIPQGDPLFAGIPEADLYFREARELPVLTAAPEWVVATEPMLFAKLDRHTSAIIILNLAPAAIDGLWNQEKISRVWTTIFDNMNIGLGQELQLFSAKSMRHNTIDLLGSEGTSDRERSSAAWSPYIDDLDFYDGDAFHNW